MSAKHRNASSADYRFALPNFLDSVLNSIKERLMQEKKKMSDLRLREELRLIRERCSRLPVLDKRSPEEILAYDDDGLPLPAN